MDPERIPTNAPADAPAPALYPGTATYPGAPNSRLERDAPQADQTPAEHDDTRSN